MERQWGVRLGWWGDVPLFILVLKRSNFQAEKGAMLSFPGGTEANSSERGPLPFSNVNALHGTFSQRSFFFDELSQSTVLSERNSSLKVTHCLPFLIWLPFTKRKAFLSCLWQKVSLCQWGKNGFLILINIKDFVLVGKKEHLPDGRGLRWFYLTC